MGGQGSGGAFGGPQYSPMNVSPTGGNGQSGTQAARYIPGLPQGQGQETLNNQRAADMAGPTTPQPAPVVNIPAPMGGLPVTPINAPSARAGEDIMTGSQIGPGATSIPGLPNPVETQYKSARDVIQGLGSAEDASPMMKYLAQRVGNKY